MLCFLSFVLAAALIPSAFAQSSTGALASTYTSTPSSAAPTHTVAVGAEGLVFSPNQLTAAVGDVIEFWFYPQNHSVARSGYKSPCIPYEDTGVGKQGFWSGFHPVAVVLSDPPKFQVTINDTEPIFFYCSAPGACINDGMIGVINANATETFDTQLEFAKNATLMFSPGQYFPSEIVPTTSSTSPTTTVTLTATSSSTSTQAASASHPLSTGTIAGIVIGGAVVGLLGAILIYLCSRQRTKGELLSSQPLSGPPSSIPPHPCVTSTKSADPPKIPHFEFNAAAPRRYSVNALFADIESCQSQSRCPAMEEMTHREGELLLPSNYVAGVPENSRFEDRQSPVRRLSPNSLPRLNPSPISPLGEGKMMYVPLHMDISPVKSSPNLRMERYDSQLGPHELAVESEPVYRGV